MIIQMPKEVGFSSQSVGASICRRGLVFWIFEVHRPPAELDYHRVDCAVKFVDQVDNF